ncbi:hypothetical protein ACFQU2_06155 [Siccirubricoccus deserti]
MFRRHLLAVPALAAWPARAQGFPNRPVTMIVPYAPGGSADVLARVIGPPMGSSSASPWWWNCGRAPAATSAPPMSR